MKKINVSIYGGKSIFGGREEPYNVDIAYCDKCEKCSFYNENTCFNAGRCKSNCKIGQKQNIMGWTSRAIKGREFYHKWKNDDSYGKLKEPNRTIGIVEDTVILNLHNIKFNENNVLIENVGFCRDVLSYIPLEQFTPEIIKKICDLRPRTITICGNKPIESYYKEHIPKFLDDLKRHFTNIYENFIKEYPEYDKKINYIGRSAYVNSLTNGSVIIDCHNNMWEIINDEIICSNWSTWLPFKGKPTEIRIKVTDDMICEITDNNQVSEKTIFYD